MKKFILKVLFFLIKNLPSRINARLVMFAEYLIKLMYGKRSGGVFLKRKGIYKDVTMSLDITEKTQRRLFLNKIYEPDETKYISENLCEGDVFIDIGANVGYFSLIAAECIGKKGKVVAFEPLPSNFEKMLYNIRLNNFENIDTYQFAVNDKEFFAPLFLNALNEGGNSLLKFDGYSNSIQVKSIVLDDFFARRYPSLEIKLVKIDVEGAEMNVVSGMQNILKKESAPDIICEITPESKDRVGSFLSGYGYKKYRLINGKLVLASKKEENGLLENFLFSKK